MDRITLVLDASGSMSTCSKEMLKNVKEMLSSMKVNAEKHKKKTLISLVTFNTSVKEHFKDVDSAIVDKVNFNYHTNGMTALFDAVGEAVESMKRSDAHLVLVFTDGYENSSLNYNTRSIAKLINDKQKTGKWTFAFNVPPGNSSHFHSTWGIPKENIREWESTNIQSVKDTGDITVTSISNYFNARSIGKNSVNNFYTTDLTNLKSAEVRSELNNISGDFIQVDVDKECQIRDLVENKTKMDYKKGIAYYQLVKPELIQENKSMLVMEKGKKAIWGGQDARDLLGIPNGRVKVIPGNHSKYEIFVQSTSVNRKTIPGTKVLVKK